MNVKALLIPMALSLCTFSLSATPPSLHFVENIGQITNQHYEVRSDIDFKLSNGGINLFVSNTSLHYQWYQAAGFKVIDEDTIAQYTVYRMDVQLLGAQLHNSPITEGRSPYYERYYKEALAGSKAHAYSKITYKEVYPSIDWVIYTQGGKVEYDFVIHPGGKVSDIRLQYAGTERLEVLACGSLQARTPLGTLVEAAPISFQQADGKAVTSSFVLNGDVLSFEVGAYEGVLVIDPVLEWATYFGSTMNETAESNNLTGYGTNAIYMIGNTPSSSNIATEGSHQSVIGGGTDGFISQFNAAGVLQWCTYYGGTHGSDNVTGVVCDSDGNVYVSGHSQSSAGIATTGAYQEARAGSRDAFLVKFTASGERIWGTYYGGTGSDKAMAISIDANDDLFITGFTLSDNGIASEGAYQSSNAGFQDNFVAKFSNDGDFVWGTFLGGAQYEETYSAVCDSFGNVYIAGYTQSTDGIASTGAHQETLGGGKDAFIAKFSPSGARLWSTYFGGEADDYVYSICSDGANLYFTGYTYSTSGIATEDCFKDTLSGTWDAMIGRFNSDGIISWSTYYGGESTEEGRSIAYNGQLVIGGPTASTMNISTEDAIQTSLSGLMDAFIVNFTIEGNRNWATYFGGDAHDQLFGTFITEDQKLYISGNTTSYIGLASEDAHQTSHGGSTFDLYLSAINICTTPTPIFLSDSSSICARGTIEIAVYEEIAVTAYIWILPEGWLGASTTSSINITVNNSSDSVGVIAHYACGNSDTTWHYINVLALPEPMIIATGSVLNTTTSFSAYQWYKNEEAIIDATNPTYTMIDLDATYSVVVWNEHDCEATSDTYTPSLTIAPYNVQSVDIYPNPISSFLYIKSDLPIFDFVIYDVLGRTVINGKYRNSIDCSNLNTGTYILVLRNESMQIIGSQKITKQ